MSLTDAAVSFARPKKDFFSSTGSTGVAGAACTTASAAARSAINGDAVVEGAAAPSSASKSSSATGALSFDALGITGADSCDSAGVSSSVQAVVVAATAFGEITGVEIVAGEPFAAAIRCSRNSSAV